MARKPRAKTPAKKAAATRKAPARKAPAKKASATKTPARKAPAKKAPARKAPARKPAAKAKAAAKPAVKKTAARKAPAAAATATKRKTTAIKAKLNKSQILDEIASQTDLPKSKVEAVLDELETLMERSLRRRAVGEFQIPGLIKVNKYTKKATKKRTGRNLHTNEEIDIPAKPARPALRFKGLKRLRDMIE